MEKSHVFRHSFCSLSYDRSIAPSKASLPECDLEPSLSVSSIVSFSLTSHYPACSAVTTPAIPLCLFEEEVRRFKISEEYIFTKVDINVNKYAESVDPVWLINKAIFNFKTSYPVSCLPPFRKQVLAELGGTCIGVLI